MGSYATCDEQLQAIQAFQQELAALDANIVAARAEPPAMTYSQGKRERSMTYMNVDE